MAERKCSNCGIPGHTKVTCLRFHDANKPGPTELAQAEELAEMEAMTTAPAGETITKGPWHGALKDGRCTWCGDRYAEGDRIRSDGQGGWECECVDDGSTSPAQWERPTAANVKLPAGLNKTGLAETVPVADIFSAPAPVSGDVFSAPADTEPVAEKRTERLGYICKDPVLGDFRFYKNGKKKGITRATSFNKSATNSKAITDWNKRNIIVGASRRPDLVAQAHGLDVNLDNAALMALADQLEDAAGGNVASAMGTDVHTWTERVDSGEAKLDDVPPHYRQAVTLYVGLLREHGFHIVPELRERTTYIEEFGGVAGTFDAILYHEPSGTYRISDTKTGKSMDNGWPEIECQSWIYQHGYNRFGTYDWHTHQWEAPQHQVSSDHGVVIHLPVAGPLAGTGTLKRTDLQAGREHAELCALVRAGGKSKPADWVNPEPVAQSWDTRFAAVQTVAEAGLLWSEARAAGVDAAMLGALVKMAQDSLRSLGVQG